jgi:hypothetical protein
MAPSFDADPMHPLNYMVVILGGSEPMVLIAAAETVDQRAAATAAAAMHQCHEASIIDTPLSGFTGVDGVGGVAVVAPEQGLVEWFPDDGQPLDDLVSLARSVAGTGWKVGVIVPSARMGEAHRALRGAPVVLQPWWADGEAIRFGGPEVP